MICVSGGVLSTIAERLALLLFDDPSVAVAVIVVVPSLSVVVFQRAEAVAEGAGSGGEIEGAKV